MSRAVWSALNLVLRGLGSGDGKGEGALAAVALSPHGGAEALLAMAQRHCPAVAQRHCPAVAQGQ